MDVSQAVGDSQVIAITGASSGIGAATARLLARQGHRVVLSARRRGLLSQLVGELEAAGGAAFAVPGDVTRAEDMRALVSAAVERYGRLDAFIACAGVASTGPLSDGDPADWDAMIDVNLRGVLHGIAAVLEPFQAQGSGHFVAITSTAAAKWVPGQGVYAATKAGVRAVCEVLRQEVGPAVRVTMVCPGATETEFTTDPELRERIAAIWMPASAVAEAVAYALAQPTKINVGEIVIRSASQP